MILSKVAAEREPPCIEVDHGHEQKRNVPRVVSIESIFTVITPKLHDKVGQRRSAHGIASDQKKNQTTFSPTCKRIFNFTEGRRNVHDCIRVGTWNNPSFSSRWCLAKVTIMTKNIFQRLSHMVLNGLKRTLYKVRRAYIAERVRDSCGEFGNVFCNNKIQTWALQGTSL